MGVSFLSLVIKYAKLVNRFLIHCCLGNVGYRKERERKFQEQVFVVNNLTIWLFGLWPNPLPGMSGILCCTWGRKTHHSKHGILLQVGDRRNSIGWQSVFRTFHSGDHCFLLTLWGSIFSWVYYKCPVQISRIVIVLKLPMEGWNEYFQWMLEKSCFFWKDPVQFGGYLQKPITTYAKL